MINEKKNVAILVWGLSSGGAERIAGLLSIYLSAYYNVYLFVTDSRNLVYEYKGEVVNIQPDSKIEYREEHIARAKEKYQIHYSISFLDDMNYLNIRTRKNDYVIVSARCTLSYFKKPHYASMYAMKKYFNHADAVVAVSEGVKYEMIREFGVKPEKIFTIYNFIQQETIRRKAAQKKWDDSGEGKKRIVSIGRLDEQKNQIRLLKQFAELRKIREDVKLILIGSGKEEASIRAKIKELGMDEDVELLPYCENPFAYLSRAYMYVMTSHYEGLPNAILEAMCLRIPVVAVDCVGGPRELLADRSDYENRISGFLPCARGLLVEDAESEDNGVTCFFRDAMRYLLEEEDYYKQIQDNERIYMHSYKNEAILEKWLEVLKQVDSSPVSPFEERLDSGKKTVIYGAGKLGREALKLCRQEKIEVLAFLVSDGGGASSSIEGIPVIGIDNFRENPAELQVLLGLHNKFHDEVVNKLLNKGYSDIRFVPFRKENEEICL